MTTDVIVPETVDGMETIDIIRSLPPGMAQIVIMDSTGDTKHMWNPDNEFETGTARKMYSDFIAKGYTAFSVNADGSKDKQLKEFNPKSGTMILVPRLGGG